jgi:hypothetical protein
VLYQISVGYKIFLETYAIVAFLAVFLVNYFIFFYRRRFLETVKEFSDETGAERARRTIGCWVYFILTPAVFFVAAGYLHR